MTPTSHPPISSRSAAAALSVATASWLALLTISPYLVSHSTSGGLFDLGGFVYLAGHFVCHQRAERSFHAWGVQLPVCARCTGLYAGAFIGSLFAAWPASRAPNDARSRAGADLPATWRRRLVLAALPTALSVALEFAGIWAQSPRLRFAAAIPLGFAAAWFVSAYLGEVLSRLFTPPRHSM